MTLSANLSSAFTRVGAELKAVRTLLNGNASDLSALTTTAKSNLVAACNDLNAQIAALSAGSGAISDGVTGTGTTWSSTKITAAVAAAVSALIASAPGTLDTLDELAAALGDDPNFVTTITTALGNRVKVDAAQSFTSGEKIQARANIDALDAAHAGTGGSAHANVVAAGAAGFMTGSDKTKLDGIAASANNYVHPTGDGNLHVPANGTGNTNKFLKASGTAGTYTWSFVVAADVGLGNVDNTSDANKPVSTAQQTALNLKANIAAPTFTGKVTTAATAVGGAGLNLPHGTAPTTPVDGDMWTTTAGLFARINGSTKTFVFDLSLYATLASPTFTGTVSGITKSMVGLGSVDNTADTAKPTSTAQQASIDAKMAAHVGTGGSSHAAVTTSVNGFMIAADKVILDDLGSTTTNFQTVFEAALV